MLHTSDPVTLPTGDGRLSTLFRFAQYFAWTEIVYGFADRLRFETDEATKAVVKALEDIGWTLAADEFDRVDPDDFTTSRWMLWREEQRAIGELMRQDGDEVGCISFATFASIYEERFARWARSSALAAPTRHTDPLDRS